MLNQKDFKLYCASGFECQCQHAYGVHQKTLCRMKYSCVLRNACTAKDGIKLCGGFNFFPSFSSRQKCSYSNQLSRSVDLFSCFFLSVAVALHHIRLVISFRKIIICVEFVRRRQAQRSGTYKQYRVESSHLLQNILVTYK